MSTPTGTASPSDPISLHDVTSPQVLRDFAPGELPTLAGQIRAFLIAKVGATGGHLGPNLGVVELTIALHRVFDSPSDVLVFDIGHQGYVHKLLTGRQDRFDTLRQAGGLSEYLSRAESPHDLMENSHASTALSYADGLVKARHLAGERDRAVVAVIGDGALTGGMAWEALNNLGAAPERPVIVVLNDNGRSYAPTTGALATHLSHLRGIGTRTTPRNVFTDLGFTCLGPVDGHDISALESALHRARSLRRPVMVHVVTVKGKGYPSAEADEADCFHTVGAIDPATGRAAKPVHAILAHPPARSWTSVFATELLSLAREREDLVAVTASMLRPTGLRPMAEAFPDRVFDVGIAEQHTVTSAAGLAMGGLHPVVAIYATFLNRAFDQVLMDVALHRLPVTFVLDRAGVTGPDGPSHHGMWDMSILAVVPGMRVAAPRDATRLRELLREAVAITDGPTALRLPRENVAPDTAALARMDGIDVLHRSAHHPLDVLLVAAGATPETVLQAATELERHGMGSTVVDPRWLTPVNPALLHLAARHQLAVTVEDNTRTGGLGSLLAQAAADAAITTPVVSVDLPHAFLPHGPRNQLLTEAGLAPDAVARTVLRALAGKPPHDAPATAGSPAVPGRAP
ncbi:1-deoxy-D-xylulose-5-phosphate synthase [Streptomyces roseoverticillatus]|uniref:1-deoxy-D-xylulose-5-phosphate synthase n=1 Tax=Streptomyces roseoverticillatus TaxID=66429 RepID=UPI001F2C7198|nr:1-deoxy-D-xylulose-5-phosphate synthase [Streptomyces roseoverticillatus]MCF3104871.1 1-deoxy-D-xylulose-5-phosphate synthase [Streptomyces roseoverticillatus]